nr:hypothetical protein [Tanacetum cinerariifolium]
MLIETTFKNMCRKQPPQITIKETPVSDLRWLLTKFDLPVFIPIRIIKTILTGEAILIKTEVEISTHLLSIKATPSSSHSSDTKSVSNGLRKLWTLPGNTVTNPKEDLKGITTRSGVPYPGPKTPSPSKQGTKLPSGEWGTYKDGGRKKGWFTVEKEGEKVGKGVHQKGGKYCAMHSILNRRNDRDRVVLWKFGCLANLVPGVNKD